MLFKNFKKFRKPMMFCKMQAQLKEKNKKINNQEDKPRKVLNMMISPQIREQLKTFKEDLEKNSKIHILINQ